MSRFVALTALLAASSPALGADVGCWDTHPGITIHVDNDLLVATGDDADYTGGFAVQATPRDQSGRALPHRWHDGLDRMLGVPRGDCRRIAWQVGLVALTPDGDGRIAGDEDRPYASLLLFGTTAAWDGGAEDVSWQSALEIGALGLEAAESIHHELHDLLGEDQPVGYDEQVSEGGEPTFRYMLARHRLLGDRLVGNETFQTKHTAAVSAGYITEASLGWSARWGRIDSSWQSFAPEVAGYLPLAMPIVADEDTRELFVFAGARIKVRAYNALLQGQVRDTAHRMGTADVEHLLGEAWAGVYWQPSAGWSVTYTLRAQTPELRRGPARRTLIWGGLSVAHRF